MLTKSGFKKNPGVNNRYALPIRMDNYRIKIHFAYIGTICQKCGYTTDNFDQSFYIGAAFASHSKQKWIGLKFFEHITSLPFCHRRQADRRILKYLNEDTSKSHYNNGTESLIQAAADKTFDT